MKRKVALLLVAMMALSLAPVNVFAATYSNRFVNAPQTVGPRSLLFEQSSIGTNYLDPVNQPDSDFPEWYVNGTDLVLPIQERITAGHVFRVTLTNAKWFFKYIDTTPTTAAMPLTGVIGPLRTPAPTPYDAYTNQLTHLINPRDGSSRILSDPAELNLTNTSTVPQTYKHYELRDAAQVPINKYETTYDPTRGIFFPTAGTSHAGNYYRFLKDAKAANIAAPGITNREIPYELNVSSLDSSVATIKILDHDGTLADAANGYANHEYFNLATNLWELRIPLVTLTANDTVDVGVEVEGGNQSTITYFKANYATAAKSDTKSSVSEVVISRDEFTLEDFIITELKPGSFRGGVVALTLPNGYHWKQVGLNSDSKPGIRVGLQPGLAWGNGEIGLSEYWYSTDAWVRGNNVTNWPPFDTKTINTKTHETDYQMAFAGSNYNNDKYTSSSSVTFGTNDSTLMIRFNTIKPSSQLIGKIYIQGLVMYADEDAYLPTGDNAADIKVRIDGDYVTKEDVLVAQRKDWNISLTTTGSIPTLVSGRYIGPSWNGLDADDNTHKTAHVILSENTSYSWWGNRTTVLALPATDNKTVKGAKFRKIEITKTSNLSSEDDKALTDTRYAWPYYNIPAAYSNYEPGTFLNDGQKHGSGTASVMVNDNTISISNVTPDVNKRMSVEFDLWVSVELGFAAQVGGDLKLSVDPSSTSVVGTLSADKLPSAVIAHVVDPIKVTTKVSDLKIGYQYQATSDIQITENGAGYLLKDKTVRISITDLISVDMLFTPSTTVKVTAGDLKIKNLNATGVGGFTSQTNSWLTGITDKETASISFDIDRQSSTPSTITISDVAVKMDRTIPLTNQAPYKVLVWGTAIAENYGLTTNGGSDQFNSNYGQRTWKADFNTAGVDVSYINVISAAPDEPNILSQEVRVPIGENYFIVNGTSYSMDAAAYISPASHSTMVPIRFVANAFGLRNDNQIVWDDSTKTVTIIAPSRTIQFTAAKSSMIVNGVSITMVSPDNLPVVAEIKGDAGHERMYIPFRALGQAFGIPVDWDEATQTAIYNKGANTNLDLPVSNTNPAVTQ